MRVWRLFIVTGFFAGVALLAGRPASAQVLTPLYTFCSQTVVDPHIGAPVCADGSSPVGNLIQGSDGYFYGTTSSGGAYNWGTVFKMTPSGHLTTIYSFCTLGFPNCTDGAVPSGGLVEGPDGNFYGTTVGGGIPEGPDQCPQGTPPGAGQYTCGTVFKITPDGVLTTLHTFCSDVEYAGGTPGINAYCADGAIPNGNLVLGNDGYLYGTTAGGGSGNGDYPQYFTDPGMIFKIMPDGTNFTTLYTFCSVWSGCADGYYPAAGLTLGSDGYFYGTTESGGAGGGTVFKFSIENGLTTLASFGGPGEPAVGGNPTSGLIEGSDGSFYGTTRLGGNTGGIDGGLYSITPGDPLKQLHLFCSLANCADGYGPLGGLTQGSDGNFYGMTWLGGGGVQGQCYFPYAGCGTIYEYIPGEGLTTLHVFCSGVNGTSLQDCPDGELPSSSLVQGSDSKFYGVAGGGANGVGIVFSLTTLASTTTVISAPPITYGASAKVTVTVTSPQNTVSGNVSLTVDGGSPLSQALSDGSTIFSIAALSAGSHALSANYAAQSNFAASSDSGSLTVAPAPLTITAKSATMVYGAALPSLTATIAGFVNGDSAASLTTPPVCTTSASSSSPVGSYPITCSGASDSNYTISYVAGTLSVTPAKLTVTANSESILFGTALPPLTASFTGFVNGDTAAVLSGAPTETTTATSSSAPGSYPITITKGTLVAANYIFTFVNGRLTINPLPQTITFSPAAGTYSSPQQVSILDSAAGATIYYTTNGIAPTTGSAVYNSTTPINVAADTTIRVLAVLTDYKTTAASATFRLKVATPTLSLKSGTYLTPQQVTISDSASNAVIWYTTDDTMPVPGEGSAVQFNGTPIAVNQNTTIKAIAAVTDWTNSSMASAVYSLKVATPTLSLASGTYSTTESVTISDTASNAVIWYTTDDSTPVPGEGTAVQYANTPIAITESTHLKAVAAVTGWTNSSMASAVYTLKVPTPTFSPKAGVYTAGQSVTINDTNSSAVIWYTTDGTTPVAGGGGSTQQYSGAIPVSSTTTLKAVAAIAGWATSSMATGTYTIR